MELHLEIINIRKNHITTNTHKLHGQCLVQQDRQCTHNVARSIKARSHNHCCCGKATSIAYSECVSVALVTQHTKSMCHMILSSVACLDLPYFSTLSHKQHIFRKNLLNMFLFSLQLLSATFLILRRIQQDIIINVQRSSCKVPVILVTI
jgi:hypothetical protein